MESKEKSEKPTLYMGINFRSELAARWAVFFDSAGIDYNYTPDYYINLRDMYVPDFYLPGLDTFCKVVTGEEDNYKVVNRAAEAMSGDSEIHKLVFLECIPHPYASGDWAFPMLYNVFGESDVHARLYCFYGGLWNYPCYGQIDCTIEPPFEIFHHKVLTEDSIYARCTRKYLRNDQAPAEQNLSLKPVLVHERISCVSRKRVRASYALAAFADFGEETSPLDSWLDYCMKFEQYDQDGTRDNIHMDVEIDDEEFRN